MPDPDPRTRLRGSVFWLTTERPQEEWLAVLRCAECNIGLSPKYPVYVRGRYVLCRRCWRRGEEVPVAGLAPPVPDYQPRHERDRHRWAQLVHSIGHGLVETRSMLLVATVFFPLAVWLGYVHYRAGTQLTTYSVVVSGYTRANGVQVGSYTRRPRGAAAADAPYENTRGWCRLGILGCGFASAMPCILAWGAAEEHYRKARKAAGGGDCA